MTAAGRSQIRVEGPYSASVLTDDGEVCGPLANLSQGLLRRCRAVRAPSSYARQRHMPGRFFSTTTARLHDYESLLERDWMLLMDFDPRVGWICEQPLRLRYRRAGRAANHVPDLLCLRGSQPPQLLDIRATARLGEDGFRAAVAATERACAEAGWHYAVLAEPAPQRLANLRWLSGYRCPAPDPDGERERVLARLAGGERTVGELLAGAREPLLARPVLLGMLWRCEARIDLDRPLSEESVVWEAR